MRILYLTHYFWPEGNAPATRVHALARRWAAGGDRVTVVTCVPSVPRGVPYAGYSSRWRTQRETVDGVDVARVWTYLAPNRGVVRRTINYLSYVPGAIAAACWGSAPDVVIATIPQFFCGWAGIRAARALRRPLVLEVRDIWPASIRTVGAMGGAVRLGWLERLAQRMYAAADRIVTVGAGYRRELIARGAAADRIDVVTNGVDLGLFRPRPPDAALRAELGLGSGFVCAYAGTIGMACGLEVALDAARRLKAEGRGDIRFLLAGDGAVRDGLEAQARAEGLDNIVFAGRMDKDRMPAVLAASDACLIHLRKAELFRTVLPSKLYEAAAMARPVIMGVEGDAADLVRETGAGVCIEPGNGAELARAVAALADDPARARAMGEAGRTRLAPRFDYDRLAKDYRELLSRVAGGAAGIRSA